jgi:hypothetical protein
MTTEKKVKKTKKNSTENLIQTSPQEKKYEIFISFKKSDLRKSDNPNDNFTRDYHIARELYEALTVKGFQVFFSEESLKLVAEDHYSEEIHKALDQSEMLVFVCCDAEFAKSKWIGHELSLFTNETISRGKKMFNLLDHVNTNDLPIQIRYNQSFFYRGEKSTYSEGIVQLTEFILNHFQKIKPYEQQMEQHMEMGKKSIARMDRMAELIGEIALVELSIVEKNAQIFRLFGINIDHNNISNIRDELQSLLKK